MRFALNPRQCCYHISTAAHTSPHSPLRCVQNLLYEERHYENETRECLNYHSAFSDTDIELMPVDDFRRMVRLLLS